MMGRGKEEEGTEDEEEKFREKKDEEKREEDNFMTCKDGKRSREGRRG